MQMCQTTSLFSMSVRYGVVAFLQPESCVASVAAALVLSTLHQEWPHIRPVCLNSVFVKKDGADIAPGLQQQFCWFMAVL